MSISSILGRIRRAQRNGTGATFSFDDMKLLAGTGVLHRLALIETDELCQSIGVDAPVWDLTLNKVSTAEAAE